MADAPDRPDNPPNFALARVFSAGSRLATLLRVHSGVELKGDALTRVVGDVSHALKVAPSAISGSLIAELGRRLDDETRRDIAWRLAGNLAALKAGRAVGRWTVQREDEWVAAQIARATPESRGDRSQERGWLFRFRILTGASATLTVKAWWSDRRCRFAAPLFGFSKPFSRSKIKLPYRDPRDMTGMRCALFIQSALSIDAPRFRRVEVVASMRTRNADLLKSRRRVATPCPRGCAHDCRVCSVGYKECPMAVHRETFEIRPCARCGADESYFDPESFGNECVRCMWESRNGASRNAGRVSDREDSG